MYVASPEGEHCTGCMYLCMYVLHCMYVHVQVFARVLLMLSLYVPQLLTSGHGFSADMRSDRFVFSWYSIMMYFFSTDECFTEEIHVLS